MANYRVSRKIGSGGFGVVYKVLREDGLACAMKKLDAAADDEGKTRFQREVRLQATMSHPNIMPILASNLSADPPWYIMPMASRSLRDTISDMATDERKALDAFFQILDGMEHAHSNGVVHRDLKPENVLFVSDERDRERVVVSDFGCGRFLCRDTPTVTLSGAPLGSLGYMAPEQWTRAKDAGIPADIFALGRILYEMLTGDLSAADPDLTRVGGKYKYVIRACTYANPGSRYGSISKLKSDLDLVTSGVDEFRTSKEQLTELMRQVVVADAPDPDDVRMIGRILSENAQDHSLVIQLARFPEKVIDLLMKETPETFAEVLRAFDEAVSGFLSFDFTDVVADFYARVFHRLADLDLQSMIIARLNEMGCSHNRWHVGQVLAGLLKAIDDPSLALAARDALQRDPSGIRFVRQYVTTSELPAVLRQLFMTELGG